MRRSVIVFLSMFALASCNDRSADTDAEPPVRGLKTILIKDVERSTVRRYPSVLQPASISTLSFEISGRLEAVNLDVGQRVSSGDRLASIDTRSLELQVESAQAALEQATATAQNAAEEAERQAELLEKGITTKAKADQAKTNAQTTAAQVVQMQRSVDTASENLTKAALAAPFDGIVNSVEVDSFSNVSAGAPVATIYAANRFETSFSVSFDVVNRLTVGKPVTVRLADNPDIALAGHVSELGARADTVSSFPVVAELDAVDPSMKAGMAVEIGIEFAVPRGQGFTLPLSVLPFEGQIEAGADPDEPGSVEVFVFDEATSTVRRRAIKVVGVRENAIIVAEGLSPGERVASAGVSFLREGQKVKLLPDENPG